MLLLAGDPPVIAVALAILSPGEVLIIFSGNIELLTKHIGQMFLKFILEQCITLMLFSVVMAPIAIHSIGFFWIKTIFAVAGYRVGF